MKIRLSDNFKDIKIRNPSFINRITSLIMCPRDDTFISTSQDNTLRLWDLNSESQMCTNVLNVE